MRVPLNANLIWGIGNMILGLLAPMLITLGDFGILASMEQSIVQDDSGFLLLASMKLVALNTLRVLPIYTGTLLLAEGLGFPDTDRSRYARFIPLIVIPAVYQVIEFSYGIIYDLGIPAISLIIAIILVSGFREMARSVIHKAIVFALLLLGVEWLDIVPMLSPYGFGRGEVSFEIKHIAVFIGSEHILNIVGIMMFLVFSLNGFLMSRLLIAYTREIETAERSLRLERLASELKLQSIDNRSLREKQALVHDLKTPLTTIQGLAGVISLSQDRLHKEYADYISDAVDKMSRMIDELLKDDNRQAIEVKELVDYALAHVPLLSCLQEFSLKIDEPSALINVNKIKMARAIINLLENALAAVDSLNGRIKLSVIADNLNVKIIIEDNGSGLSPENLQSIWEIGFSTKGSSGLGLAFVKDAVETNEGTVEINNNDKGVIATITLPRCNYDCRQKGEGSCDR